MSKENAKLELGRHEAREILKSIVVVEQIICQECGITLDSDLESCPNCFRPLSYVNTNDAVAFSYVDHNVSRLYCSKECFDEENPEYDFTRENVLTKEDLTDIEDELWCDNCGEKIKLI